MYIGLLLIIILIGLFARDKARLFGYLAIVFLIVLSYGVNDPDFANYERAYNHIASGNYYVDLGAGWYWICKFFIWLGFDYYMSKVAIIFISGIFLNSFIGHYVKVPKNISFVWICYFIFPCLMDFVQTRFFLASSIAVWATRFLIDNKKMGRVAYIIALIIAYRIHSSVFFFFLFLLFPLLKGREKMIPYIIAGFVVAILVLKGPLLNLASALTNVNRMTRYFEGTGRIGTFGILAYTATIFAFTFVVNSLRRSIKNTRSNYWDFLYNAVLFSWILLPLTLLDTNFFRIQRPLWLMLYVGAAILLDSGDARLRIGKRTLTNCRQVIFALALFGFIFYISIFNFNVIEAYYIR